MFDRLDYSNGSDKDTRSDCGTICMPRKKKTELTVADRIVTAVCGILIALFTGSLVWLVISMRWRNEAFPYWFVLVFAGIMGLLGFVIGPQKMMDVFERMWRRK